MPDNSDSKLLHVITLLKSQFTQPQQIVLRWVPRVMETVFSTVCPLPLLRCQNHTECLFLDLVKKKLFSLRPSPFSSFLHLFLLLPTTIPCIFLCFLATGFASFISFFRPLFFPVLSPQKDLVCLLNLTLLVCQLDIIKVI